MKKIFTTMMMVIVIGFVTAQTSTIYLNSKTVTCNVRGIKQECLQYKKGETDTAWSILNGSIKGFKYNPGYFYMLQVKSMKAKTSQWQLMKVLSKTKSVQQQQPGDTIAMLSKPPAELIGNWSFTRLPADAGSTAFTKEFLRFDAVEMRVNGKASCNGFFGNYTADTIGNKKEIHFEAIGHTMMACENLATENKMLSAMEKVTSWSREGDKLYLKANGATLIELTRAAEGVI